MKLYLVRHGDAVSHVDDSYRALSEKGEQETYQLAHFLQKLKLHVPQIYHSEKHRAIQTATILAHAIKPDPSVETLKGLMPEDQIKPIAAYCNHWPTDVMLVGHLPFMGRLAAELLCDRQDQPCFNFETSAILCLERLGVEQWCAVWFVNPRLLSSTQ